MCENESLSFVVNLILFHRILISYNEAYICTMDQKYDNNFMTYSIRQVICQPSNRLLYRLNAYVTCTGKFLIQLHNRRD